MEEPSPHLDNEGTAPLPWRLSSETSELDLRDHRGLSVDFVSYQSGGAGGMSGRFPTLVGRQRTRTRLFCFYGGLASRFLN